MSLSKLIEANVMATGEFVNTPKRSRCYFYQGCRRNDKTGKELLISEGDKKYYTI